MTAAVAPRVWPGETFVCLASGPSMTAEDAAFVRGKARVIAINRTVDLAPWADVLYCCDAQMWKWMKGAQTFPGLKFGLQKVSADWGVTVLKNTGREGLELDPSGLRTGENSGYQAINLAVHLGARRIVLVGYDLQRGPKNERRWHGDHPHASADRYETWAPHFATLVEPLAKAGVSIVNCSRRTALTCFERADLTDVVTSPQVAA